MQRAGASAAIEAGLGTVRHPARSSEGDLQGPSSALVLLLAVFFWLEYARPAGIVNLRLQFLISLLLPLAWIAAPRKPWSPILTYQFAFLVQCALHVPLALNNFAAYMTTRAMYGNVAIAVAMSWLLTKRRSFALMCWMWVLVMAWAAVKGIMQGGRGPGGFLRDENDLALGLTTAIAFSMTMMASLRGVQRLLSAGLTGLFAVGIVLSFSRGGFLAMAAVAFYFFLGSRHKIRDLGIVMVMAATFMLFAPKEYLSEIGTISNTQESTALRRQFLWATAVNIWKDHVVFGAGPGNFQFLAGDYQPRDGGWPEEYFQRSSSGTVTHSTYFQLLAEQGLIGVGLFAAIVWTHFRTLRKLLADVHDNPAATPELTSHVEAYARALGGAMLGALAGGAFLSTLYYPYVWYLSGMAVALSVGARRELRATQLEKGHPEDVTPITVGVRSRDERSAGMGVKGDVSRV